MSQKFIINGGRPIEGAIKVKGAKNAALKVFPLALMTSEPIGISNMPEIEDCYRAEEMLVALGHEVSRSGKGVVEISYKSRTCVNLPPGLVNKFRASIMFVGPLLATCGEVCFPHPGGCVIGAGTRPIDMFLDGFVKMGAKVEVLENSYRLSAKKLKGATIFFPKITVTGTESLMTTACLAEGITILKNCAMEPEIPALAEFLNTMGAKIAGAGTPVIKIEGVKKLRGGNYMLIPDRIETGTFAILAAVANSGEVLIENCNPGHLEALWALFDKIGVNYKLGQNSVKISPTKKILPSNIVTHEYPGFATDLQSPYTVLMTQAHGLSLIHETIHDRRLLFTDMLTQMGANIIMADPHRVVVSGPSKLYARKLISPDLRAGIALVIAALIAEGSTEIDNIYQIERGYEDLVERLTGLGADIKKV
ncbi:MAG: UDP-N-acetylglucosamine 1-carboxyvinyltransferase [Candidatus Portnoybacteria bacterium CG02_land_8_20_14_3_00_45_8]|uniref:UDP-N-acetylglucosamine 1-carboxyvinyltransferase n=1 Tax=Candidatus Portnoybacteria bacterium CG02_land_8_20_14_3_00_45_8 TaxID=1974807 RepID=A0A2M7D5Q4_9BACT|nr:MAG: UDP-N-acetylglucosamine 1-carboxyvinyltransferase [Candidatus Portnoybacteria bacterium CG02_land_8_20_14_3_00_45_8]